MNAPFDHPHIWHLEVHDCFTPVAAEWRALEAAGCCTMFQTADWLSVWYDAVSRHGVAEPLIVSVTKAGADRPSLMLPLCRWRDGDMTLVTFADLGVSDFCAPLFAPDDTVDRQALVALGRQLTGRLAGRADAIILDKLLPRVGGHANPLLSLGVVPLLDFAWRLRLRPGGETLPAAIPQVLLASTEKRRAALGRKTCRQVTWEEAPHRLPSLLDELVAIRRQRSERKDRSEILDEPVWADFYATLVARRHREIRPLIARLQADGQTIATFMGVGHQGSMHYLLPSFVMTKWSRYTPGFQLVLDAIEQCQARHYRLFDFTVGNEPYKQAFGASPEPLYRAFLPLSARGHQARMAWRLRHEVRKRPRLKALIRKLIPQV